MTSAPPNQTKDLGNVFIEFITKHLVTRGIVVMEASASQIFIGIPIPSRMSGPTVPHCLAGNFMFQKAEQEEDQLSVVLNSMKELVSKVKILRMKCPHPLGT